MENVVFFNLSLFPPRKVAASNAKLALFYDWLFFDTDKDNIMNIEPAILVMHHSMKPHPAITATLLDFLCRIVNNFYPREYERVKAGIFNSLRQVRVMITSSYNLTDHSLVDAELGSLNYFPKYLAFVVHCRFHPKQNVKYRIGLNFGS